MIATRIGSTSSWMWPRPRGSGRRCRWVRCASTREATSSACEGFAWSEDTRRRRLLTASTDRYLLWQGAYSTVAKLPGRIWPRFEFFVHHCDFHLNVLACMWHPIVFDAMRGAPRSAEGVETARADIRRRRGGTCAPGRYRSAHSPALGRPEALTLASRSPARSLVLQPSTVTVVGMGSVGMDFLASVASFPKPDEKMRTDELEMQGGGNCGNALTAVARLFSGLPAHVRTTVRVVSKIGTDAAGDAILKEFAADGIDTSNILVSSDPASKSPFTYIIVDRETATRTCIHTPGDPYLEDEMTVERVDRILEGASAVYFDGRLAEPALVLARAARARGIKVLVEAERLRPGLDKLLGEADFVVTSTGFPSEWTGIDDVEEAMAAILESLPHCDWIITTLGKRGALLLEGNARDADDSGDLSDVVSVGSIAAGPVTHSAYEPRGGPAQDPATLRRARQEAADRAAKLNADAGKGASYDHVDASEEVQPRLATSPYRLTSIAAASVDPAEVVDTTGAGDAFIGTMLFSVAMGLSPAKGARLGSVVAAAKCLKLGARPGLVGLADIHFTHGALGYLNI